MSNTQQQPFGIHFVLPPKMEVAETHIVFLVAADGLHPRFWLWSKDPVLEPGPEKENC
jgi:hypothetical protein